MGRFSVSGLSAAKDLHGMYQRNLARIEELTQTITTSPASLQTLYQVDEISDLASQTADISQAVALLFPSNTWQQQGQLVLDLMNKTYHWLNSNQDLYKKLLEVKEVPLNPVQEVYLHNLIRECERQGTHTGVSNPHTLLIAKLESLFMSNADRNITVVKSSGSIMIISSAASNLADA